jgi:hypothetical protein
VLIGYGIDAAPLPAALVRRGNRSPARRCFIVPTLTLKKRIVDNMRATDCCEQYGGC